ncbi:hypothetical protein AXF42_Ash018352 [Apostasia shenzhenica]|uniref:HAT C-terminal dimerisation domain-containing protein n=1 Tax=Apostasia shenzhenica TaxID=1088818 RepID=A0A2H9ZR84_9ASPA|nr:hypothetical protein AXF42_Ash018352 [Apostasia shenzhenica]
MHIKKNVCENFLATFLDLDNPDCISDRAMMDPNIWWVTYGASTPLLQQLAMKLLGQPSSSSCYERNRAHSFIHSMRRNKILSQHAKDLVFVYNNLCLLSKGSPQYMERATKMWDVSPDALVFVEDTCMFEVTSLSLDEPELEVMLVDEADDEEDLYNNL